jgi:hypothetical protein
LPFTASVRSAAPFGYADAGWLGSKVGLICLVPKSRFAIDSPLEREGFEPSVPHEMGYRYKTASCASVTGFHSRTDSPFRDRGPRVRIHLPPAESRANHRFLSGGAHVPHSRALRPRHLGDTRRGRTRRHGESVAQPGVSGRSASRRRRGRQINNHLWTKIGGRTGKLPRRQYCISCE